MINRLKRLFKTFVAKKYVAWGVGSYFLTTEHITGQDWVLLTGAIFALDLATKMKAPAPPDPEGKIQKGGE